ncbi:hypothetical protein M9Y10_042831 [Tritrichomonas musculus]|uniref:DUF3447 domain-containing protein n=1 Tax=Tritrichomonas musculus TaxID=1915356 RepID=A0ABR2JY39_9EUKA
MQLEKYLEEKVDINQKILEFIDNGNEEEYKEIEKTFLSQKIQENPQEFKIIIRLISKISNNYHRLPHFFDKIERILMFLKEDIKKIYSNSEIFDVFKNNKRLLYFLIKESFIEVDEKITEIITSKKFFIQARYPNYFLPEIKDFISFKIQKKIESQNRNLLNLNKHEKIDQSIFDEMRKIGENENHLCQLIRNDSINDFISHVNRSNISFASTIKPSIFETNSFLIKNNPTLIEYSAFFGSVQIFKYLYLNKVEIKPSIWQFAIHSRSSEMIHVLEECQIKPLNDNYQKCLNESIKCHHNEIANYIFDNFIQNASNSTFSESIRYFNFLLFPDDLTDPHSFYNLCRSNYIFIVDFILKTMEIDVNTKIVQNYQIYRI